MEYIKLRTNFDDRSDYRILQVGGEIVRELSEKLTKRVNKTEISKYNNNKIKQDEEGENNDSEVLLMMKGQSQLFLSDDKETFRVRRVEYSNTLLITEEHLTQNKKEFIVISAAERIFEVKPARAQFDALQILEEHPITIEELEANNNNENNNTEISSNSSTRVYTFPQLVALSRCSSKELAKTLSSVGAIVYKGYVRILHPQLLREALRAVLFFLESINEFYNMNSIWEAVEANFCPSVYPPIVIHVIRAVYGAKKEKKEKTKINEEEEEINESYNIAELMHIPSVLQALAAAIILQETKDPITTSFPTMEFDLFYELWTDSIPISFFTKAGLPPRSDKAALLEFLNGTIIVRRPRLESYVGASVILAPCSHLAVELAERFDQLFELNPGRWEAEALRAYVEPLLDPGITFDSVVHRHAREFRGPNQPVTYGRLA